MSEHAAIAPSSLARTVRCRGWIKNASLLPPEAPTDASKEGDAAHWVALQMALGVVPDVGTVAPNGVAVTDDMIDGGYIYVEALEGLPGKMEQRVEIKRIHETECWGTPDRFTWTPNTKTLRVFDYKFGFEYVEVYENWQLISYASGIMDTLGLNDDIDQVILELVIVQPRLSHRDGPIRMWPVAATKIRAMINQAYAAAHEALGPNPSTESGPHCLHCPARVNCVTFQRTVANILDFAGQAEPALVNEADIGNELRLVMDARQRLKARQTGLEAVAEAMLRAGKRVPHFALEPGQSRLKWFDDVRPEEVEAMAKLRGKTVLRPPTLITPTQAIKSKALDQAVMSAYADRPPGAMKLVPDTVTKASKVFGK
jgi:hypothetical protein